jgi:hypothetical protein
MDPMSNLSHDDYLNRLWRETMTRLTILATRVHEGKFLQEASEFARWLRMSGMFELFAGQNKEHLYKQVENIIYECGEHWNNRRSEAKATVSEFEAMNHKLDLIAGHVAKLSAPAQPSLLDSAVVIGKVTTQ